MSFGEVIKNLKIKKQKEKIEETKKKKKIKKIKKISSKLEYGKNADNGVGPLIVVKKDMSENMDNSKIKEWLSSLPGYLEGLTKVYDKNVKLYDYQIAHLNNKSKFRICGKSRQVGFSFGCVAAEAIAKSQLKKINTSIFISYNQEEADEKILAAKMLYESIPAEYRKKRITDNKKSQVFRDNNGNTTRIISTAQRPPRGKGYNTDVYGDEFAFWQYPEKIFVAAAPIVTRGTGVFTIGSTPQGSRGKFHEILTDRNSYPQFSRQYIYWWHCPDLCNNIEDAFINAKKMTTEERIRKYGNESMNVLFDSMSIDDFQQEYEISFIDENISYFPPETINKCSYFITRDEFNYDEIDDKDSKIVIEKTSLSNIESKYKKIKMFLCKSIEELYYKVSTGEISPNLFGGFDVGRKKDKSELTILEEIMLNDNTSLQIVRFTMELDRIKFEKQKQILRKILEELPIKKLGIDCLGIGANLAEDLSDEFQGTVESVPLDGTWKDRAAQRMKIRFEGQTIAIPDDYNLKKQITSIKKKITPTGYATYDAEKNKEHHGDKFWSLAIACSMGYENSYKEINITQNKSDRLITVVSPKIKTLAGGLKSNEEETGIRNSPRIFNSETSSIIIPGMGSLPSPINEYLGAPELNIGSFDWSKK